MKARRHQSSLEGILDFSEPFLLRTQQRELANSLVFRLVQHYSPQRIVHKGYKPAALIHATIEHVASPDTFMNFFISYIYEDLCSEQEPAVDYDITHSLSYLEGFSSWESEQMNKLHDSLERFADYIVDNFLLLRTLAPI